MSKSVEERLAALEQSVQPKEPYKPASPHQPIDFTKNASLDAETFRELSRGVELRPGEIVRDHLGKSTQLPGVHGASSGKPGGNFVEPRPLVSESFWDPNRPPDDAA